MKNNNKNSRNIHKKGCKKLTRKKKLIIGGCVAATVLILVIVLAIVLGKDDKTDVGGDTQQSGTVDDWDNRIADLENEPVSDLDVVYKDKKENAEKKYLIQVNKSQNCIIIYKKGSDGKYTKPYKAMICSVGYDTPTGEFETSDKYQWKIVNGNVWSQYATRVVGNVLFHSMPYATNSKDSLIAQYYNQLGSTLSASCIRLSAKDAQWIMENCPAGTKVKIYESVNEEPLERPKSITIPEDAVWDPTDSDPANPYHSVQIAFDGIPSSKAVERGTQINYLDGVKIKDTCGNDISSAVVVVTTLDPFKLGTYEVKYYVEDAAGKTAEATTLYTIVDTTAPQFTGLKSTMNFATVAEVTRENILKNIAVIDNNEILDKNNVIVTIPNVTEGNNVITLSVTDAFNNTTVVNVTAVVSVKAPVIRLKSGTESILPLTQKVDKNYALSRVVATDDGASVASDKISVTITPMEWGYAFKYSVTDANGYSGVLYDSVTYLEYNIHPAAELKVTDITDKEQLLKGVELKNNLGGSLEASQINVAVKHMEDRRYQVTYTYEYTSPLGKRTATSTAVATLEGDVPDTSEKPVASQKPENNPGSEENPGDGQGGEAAN